MPMHDWTRVEAGIYHDFHNVWLLAIRKALNGGLLPGSYYALMEQVTLSSEADLLTLQGPTGNGAGFKRGRGVHSAVATRPAVAVLEREERAPKKRPRDRIAVRHVSNHKVVAVIELLSPGNKAGARTFKEFVSKAVAVLIADVNLFLVDPFRPSTRDPDGIHAAIWKDVVKPDPKKRSKPYSLTAKRPLVAASYCAGPDEITAAVEPFAVGEPVPDMPLFLTPDEDYVTVPLEATYQAAWPDVPKVWRDALER
jgi:hypothetical protein